MARSGRSQECCWPSLRCPRTGWRYRGGRRGQEPNKTLARSRLRVLDPLDPQRSSLSRRSAMRAMRSSMPSRRSLIRCLNSCSFIPSPAASGRSPKPPPRSRSRPSSRLFRPWPPRPWPRCLSLSLPMWFSSFKFALAAKGPALRTRKHPEVICVSTRVVQVGLKRTVGVSYWSKLWLALSPPPWRRSGPSERCTFD
jgi:hypothetical protein